MCGICGFKGLHDDLLLRRMCNVLKHRGPDSEGYYSDENVALGARRLSIIDLQTGNQPIHNEENSMWVTLNGEIYNYRSLRKSLESEGHDFYTNSDTEVLIHAYEQYGLGMVNHLRGMFAFAIWDSPRRRLILARDRLGIKPLYYYKQQSVFLFASEIKAILEYDELEREVDMTSLQDYLTYFYVPAPKTIFRGIRRLPPACLLILDDGGLQIRRYWDLNLRDEESFDESYYVSMLERKIAEAVTTEMISDVPIGILLSGGLDSTTIAYFASKSSETPINTFTVGFEEQDYDEANAARSFANWLGSVHHTITVKANAYKLLPMSVAFFDEPFGNPTSILQYLICSCAKRFVKVSLCGSGGDEIFGGYPKYLGLKLLRTYTRVPRPIRHAVRKVWPLRDERRNRLARWSRLFFEASELDQKQQYITFVTYLRTGGQSDILKPDATVNKQYDPLELLYRLLSHPVSPRDAFDKRVFYVELNSYLPYNILEYSDKSSMAASLEVRVPLLDYNLVEFAARIPSSLRIKGMTLKYSLKKIAKKNFPRYLVAKNKMGFCPPLQMWLSGELKELAYELLDRNTVTNRGYLNPDKVERLLAEHFKERKDHSIEIYGLMNLEMWNRLYIDDGGSKYLSELSHFSDFLTHAQAS